MSSAAVTLLLDRRATEELGLQEASSPLPRPLTLNPTPTPGFVFQPALGGCRNALSALAWPSGWSGGMRWSGERSRLSGQAARVHNPLHLPWARLLAPQLPLGGSPVLGVREAPPPAPSVATIGVRKVRSCIQIQVVHEHKLPEPRPSHLWKGSGVYLRGSCENPAR